MTDFVYWQGARLTPWMLYCLLRLDADLRRLFGVHLVLDSSKGIRLNSEQRAIFFDRYRQQSSGRGPFNDVRWFEGRRYVRHSGLGTVAPPGESNHEIQGDTGAVDLADSGGPGIGTMGSERSNWLRAHAADYDLDPEGFEFEEAWHYAIHGIFRTPPDEIPIEILKLGDPMSLRIIDSPFYRASNMAVIHNGAACESVPAGWVNAMTGEGKVPYVQYDDDNLLKFEVDMVWRLGGLDAQHAAEKTTQMLNEIKEKGNTP